MRQQTRPAQAVAKSFRRYSSLWLNMRWIANRTSAGEKRKGNRGQEKRDKTKDKEIKGSGKEGKRRTYQNPNQFYRKNKIIRAGSRRKKAAKKRTAHRGTLDQRVFWRFFPPESLLKNGSYLLCGPYSIAGGGMVFARSVLRMRTCQEDDERGERERKKEREKTRRQKRPLQVVSVSVWGGQRGGSRRWGRGPAESKWGSNREKSVPNPLLGPF